MTRDQREAFATMIYVVLGFIVFPVTTVYSILDHRSTEVVLTQVIVNIALATPTIRNWRR